MYNYSYIKYNYGKINFRPHCHFLNLGFATLHAAFNFQPKQTIRVHSSYKDDLLTFQKVANQPAATPSKRPFQKCLSKWLLDTVQKTGAEIFPEMKLRGLVPNSQIYLPVSNLCIPRMGPPIWLQQNSWTDSGNM